jgi:hypothetical protein
LFIAPAEGPEIAFAGLEATRTANIIASADGAGWPWGYAGSDGSDQHCVQDGCDVRNAEPSATMGEHRNPSIG